MADQNTPTMKQIAELAGVSVMTVSRALKNHPRQSAETRARIQKIAMDIGWRPNPMLAALMAHVRSNRIGQTPGSPVIAFLTWHLDKHVYDEEAGLWLSSIYKGGNERARTLGYKLERFALNAPGMSTVRMEKVLQARGILGVILAPLSDPIPDIDFDWSGFACATIGFSYRGAVLHRAVNDQFSSMRLAVTRLRDLGYRRIGLAIRYEDDARVEHKWTGALWSFRSLLPKGHRLPVFLWHDWHPDGFGEWVEREKPEVIITLHAEVRGWLQKLGKRVPRDIGLASLNLQGDQAGFSGINQNNRLLGAVAVDLVVEQINHNERGVPPQANTVMLASEWMNGETTREQARDSAFASAGKTIFQM
ncbi:LacI family transcriptional regulator [Opitutaceae bacterium TAV4]|nr:LacI family transcriptional regulator [Opitutaceae bacterium TAV4]RRK01651.1 LacI family transcriptional regulator [Opitutaceae bacterium TAV3]